MIGTPKLENRKEQRYLGIRTRVQMKQIGAVLPALHNQLLDWMETKGVQPVGAPFFRYLVIDMENGFEMEVGVPIAEEVGVEGNIRMGFIPAGRYATLLHTGHYSGLYEATSTLLDWGYKNGIEWQVGSIGSTEAWESRLEIYLNVGREANPEKWETEIAFLTADS